MLSNSRLAGAALVVMGGTTGLGLSAARAFVAQGAGVVVAGRDPERLRLALEILGPGARGLAGDARDPETAVAAVELAVSEFGRLTGLYHVAGGSGRRMGDGPLHELTAEGWRQTMELNLSSVAFSNQAAIRQFLAQGTGGKKMGKVTVDDTALFIGRFANGAIANLEATRFALGRKNHIAIEINGSKGSLAFDFEDMNRLKYFDNTNPNDRQGFRDILVTQGGGTHPYVGNWWPPGHIVGYEHTFVHTIADFVNAVVNGKSVQPTFEDGLRNQRVLEAVEESAKAKSWVKI